jgi:hypothetical protein
MLTKLSQEVNRLNEAIRGDLRHLKVNAVGLCRPIPDRRGEGNLNYYPEDNSKPVSLDESADVLLWHTLDNSTVEAINTRIKRDVYTVAIVVFTRKPEIDVYLKSKLESLIPDFEYLNAEYTATSILNTYNINIDFYKFDYNLFVIRYQVKVKIEKLNCVICIPRPDTPIVTVDNTTLDSISLKIE